ncbi:MAG: hypothetical protein ACYCPQ_01935 [Elusimicrobiota bacterium]
MKNIILGAVLVLARIPFTASAADIADAPASDVSMNIGQAAIGLSANGGLGINGESPSSILEFGAIDSNIPNLAAMEGRRPAVPQNAAAVPAKQAMSDSPAASGQTPSKEDPDTRSSMAPGKISARPAIQRLARRAAGILGSLAKTFGKNLSDPRAFDFGSVPGKSPGSINLMKLGKKPAAHDPRTLILGKYLSPQLPVAPSQADFSAKIKNWGMMLNDAIGDCTIAAAGHQIQQWTANAGKEQTPSNQAILSAYEAVSGYNPNDPNSDVGAVVLDVLNYWRKIGVAGHKIGAFVSVEVANPDHIRQAVWIFGGAYLGLQMPISAQKQNVWAVPPDGPAGDGTPGSWGGHAVEIAGYGPKGVLVVTWGALKWMTWGFFQAYCDEAYAILSNDFLKNGKTPNNGLDIAALKADLLAVTGN